MRAETIGLVGRTTKDVERERHILLNMGMNAVSRGEVTSKEVTEQLAKADVKRLPVELMSRLLDSDYYDTPVMNEQSGLAMYAPREEGTPNFALLSEEVEELEDAIADESMDRDTFEHLTVKNAITHDAIQLEPYVDKHEVGRARAHNSFGYMVSDIYLPVVTVLNAEHPVVQLIEQRRQEAQAI